MSAGESVCVCACVCVCVCVCVCSHISQLFCHNAAVPERETSNMKRLTDFITRP